MEENRESDDIEDDAVSDSNKDKRHQSAMFKSQVIRDTKTSFKLQEILKKRFKSFTRVKKYKALEKKIVYCLVLNHCLNNIASFRKKFEF